MKMSYKRINKTSSPKKKPSASRKNIKAVVNPSPKTVLLKIFKLKDSGQAEDANKYIRMVQENALKKKFTKKEVEDVFQLIIKYLDEAHEASYRHDMDATELGVARAELMIEIAKTNAKKFGNYYPNRHDESDFRELALAHGRLGDIYQDMDKENWSYIAEDIVRVEDVIERIQDEGW